MERVGNGLKNIFLVSVNNIPQSSSFKFYYITGLFDSVICTGQFEDTDSTRPGHELVTKLTKQQVH